MWVYSLDTNTALGLLASQLHPHAIVHIPCYNYCLTSRGIQDELGDILRKTRVSFVSLSCIVHTL